MLKICLFFGGGGCTKEEKPYANVTLIMITKVLGTSL